MINRLLSFILICFAIPLVLLTAALAQSVKVDLPHGLNNATRDPSPSSEARVVVTILDHRFYVDNELISRGQLGGKIGELAKRQTESTKVVYIASGANVEYGSVVDVIHIIREQEIGRIGLLVNIGNGNDPGPGLFLVEVPMVRRADDDLSKLKPNPLTLVASISADGKIRLNSDDKPRRGELCFGVGPDFGSLSDPNPLAQCLVRIFQRRKKLRAYAIGLETRSDLPEDERVEKTIFIKAPRSIKYGEVVRVIDAIKRAGANPIGLQIDDLPQ